PGSRSITQHGRELGRGNRTGTGANLALPPAVDAADEHDPRTGIGGMQGERDGKPGMDADPGNGRSAAKRGLLARSHTPAPSPYRVAHHERIRSATPDGLVVAVDGREFLRCGSMPPAVPRRVKPL